MTDRVSRAGRVLRLVLAAALLWLSPGREFFACADDAFVEPVVPGSEAGAPSPVVQAPSAGAATSAVGANAAAGPGAGRILLPGYSAEAPGTAEIGSQSAPPSQVEQGASALESAADAAGDDLISQAAGGAITVAAAPGSLASSSQPRAALRGVARQADVLRAQVERPSFSPETAALQASALFEGSSRMSAAAANGVLGPASVPAGAPGARAPPAETSWPTGDLPKGRVDQTQAVFLPQELPLARLLASEGHVVSALPQNAALPGRQPDASVDGVRVEFKTRDLAASSKGVTDYKWVLHVVKDSLKGVSAAASWSMGQARVLLLDARGSGLTADQAAFAAWKLDQRGILGPKLDSLRIVGDGFDKAYGAWPGIYETSSSNGVLPGEAPLPGPGPAQDKRISDLSPPPVPSGAVSLSDYRYPLLANLWLHGHRVLKYAFLGAYITLATMPLLSLLGCSVAVAPTLAAAACLNMHLRHRARPVPFQQDQLALLQVFLSETGFDMGQAVNAEQARGIQLWNRGAAVFKAVLKRAGVALEKAPLFLIENEEHTNGEFGAGSRGRGIGSGSFVRVGYGTAGLPQDQIAGVVAHELGHLYFGDPRGWDLKTLSVLMLAAWPGLFLWLAASPGPLFWHVSILLAGDLCGLGALLSSLAFARAKELRADHFAAWLAGPTGFRRFLSSLIVERQESWVDALLSPYPKESERVRRLEKLEAARAPSMRSYYDEMAAASLPDPGGSGAAPK